ncbi:22771_t:CDS:2 [Cetraspora pellucida]|uniref:22771_t:CDS:1 n=1 Tax=Cetraspora pellucida TaxID=1433469 RepID=A0A9N9IQJ8_9GLOM|nr:22771_t:CDS:2 [Cetraspora pellucida]
MADEEQIIRDRLTVDERNLRRVTRKIGVFLNSLELGNLKEARVQFNDFIVDFSSYEIGLIRFQVIHDMNLRETRHWEEEALNIGMKQSNPTYKKQKQIEETKRIIEKLEAELEAEEEIRRNKIEYDQLASEINELQSREESINEITKLDEETLLIEEKERLFDETLSHRRAQLERVLSVIQDVQSQIQIEQEQNRHILGEDEEPDATPESIRSEFASPIGSPIPDIQVNGADDTVTHEVVDTVNNIRDPPQTNGNEVNSPRPINGDSTLAVNDNGTPVLQEYQDHSNTPSRQDGSSSGSEKVTQETIPEEGAVVGEAGEVDEEGSIEEMGEVVEDDDESIEDENMGDVDIVASDEDDYTNFQQEQDDECDDIPILDDGEIVEDVEDVFIGKRKRGDDEDDDDDDEEGSLHEKHSRISLDEYEDEGVIEESDGVVDDDGAVDEDDDDDDDDNATIEDNEVQD